MKPIIVGALIGVSVSIVANLAGGHGWPDAMEGAFFCWGPLGAVLGALWTSNEQRKKKKN